MGDLATGHIVVHGNARPRLQEAAVPVLPEEAPAAVPEEAAAMPAESPQRVSRILSPAKSWLCQRVLSTW